MTSFQFWSNYWRKQGSHEKGNGRKKKVGTQEHEPHAATKPSYSPREYWDHKDVKEHQSSLILDTVEVLKYIPRISACWISGKARVLQWVYSFLQL